MLLPWNSAVQVHIGGAPLEAALLGQLPELERSAKRGANLHLVLADAHFHFDLVNGDYRSSSDRHLQAIASACISEILGDVGSDQVVRWQLQPDLRHMLICAMLSKDVAMLDEGAARHHLNLRSLQSEFCTQWNAHQGQLPAGSGVLAVTGAGHAVVVVAQGGSITALSAGSTPDAKALDELVEQLLASEGLDARAIGPFVQVQDRTSTLAASQRWISVNAVRGTL